MFKFEENSVRKPKVGESLWGDNYDFKKKSKKASKFSTLFYQNGYVVLSNAIDLSECDKAINDIEKKCNSAERGNKRISRVVNLHKEIDSLKDLITKKSVISILDELFGFKTSVYTSLTFKYGTEQPIHIDSPVFHTSPEGFYFGVWFALEDSNETNGCLKTIEKSHLLKRPNPTKFAKEKGVTEIDFNGSGLWTPYQDLVRNQSIENGFEEKLVPVKKGDVLIWHPNLPHGGSKILNTDKTRFSIVYHVVPEGVPVYQADRYFDDQKECPTLSQKNYYHYNNTVFMDTQPYVIKVE
tara:strand:- start:2946 stop:3836 length:891 start_codon:yes stop_codon:yes gene_type:complete